MAGSITYPPVTGPCRHGRAIVTVAPGDIISGYTPHGDIVVGRVIATHPHYPSVTITGVAGFGGSLRGGRFTVHLSGVIDTISPRQHAS